MNLSEDKVRTSVLKLKEKLNSKSLDKFLNIKEFKSQDVDELIELLQELTNDAENAVHIRNYFSYLVLPIASLIAAEEAKNIVEFQRKFVVLSIFAETSNQVLRFCIDYFSKTNISPFHSKSNNTPKKRIKKSNDSVPELEIVKACLRFLKLDTSFFRRTWNWDEFIEIYSNCGCDLQKYLSNKIIAMVFGMINAHLAELNAKIPIEVAVKAEICHETDEPSCSDDMVTDDKQINWSFRSNVITEVEGVYLPIFNKQNYEFYHQNEENLGNIIRVDSTKINIRSLALGISSGKAICLSGPVGCGKSTLVEYLAKKTGRLAPKLDDFSEFVKSKIKVNGGKRKAKVMEDRDFQLPNSMAPKSGFLRIQLGDQTDGKVLLGQYRCTDIPGEFLWQPGVLTQAVMNGYWILLEDIDSATQDVCTILTNLMENNYLNVPGFRENLKVASGFQLFVTLRTQKTSNTSANSPHLLLEKHLYSINILSLSRVELSEIICRNFPKLSSIARRIVDVFLTFSSGCHSDETENIDYDLAIPNKPNNEDMPLPTSRLFNFAGFNNSTRMVSTRDLLKLCKRSHPSFDLTSMECAYFVFQNCVDLFCSHLPAGSMKTDLTVSIGSRLGIIESRCLHMANESKPNVTMTSDDITVGRASLCRQSKEIYAIEKRRKMIENGENDAMNHEETNGIKKTAIPTFSFTRISSCILERIAVCVSQNEPILLVGETGVGKTSSIQYLAHQTNHKLVVVNMNNQSDVSDLIGGFRPVDISFVISPLRIEFEGVFSKTFDLQKNEKFLNNVSVCYNQGNYSILLKLMLKIVPSAIKKSQDENTVERWKSLEIKLTRLEQQLNKSVNLSFAFIPGSLVNCIKNGDWVLLDEINLASTETLECLSTILEPDGSVVLLERGDFVPIKRHPDFRIFSCMNPNTDVGKKDLPVGIRNRFTEFFVDELTTESDLLIIVGDYLNATGIQKSRIYSAVKLYRKLRELAQLELNDGLGNKPVFSLRTLCRALRIAAKNLCGSIERNIYESFCLSFLTQLDSASHEFVLKLIQNFLISDAKKILSQKIPKPAGEQLNFEGYWIQVGEKEPQECSEYILTDSVKKNLRDLSRIISIGKLPILLQGPTSAGKTSLIEYIAKRSGNFCLRINNHEHTDLQEYIGTYVADTNGKLTFQEGVLVKAMRNGYWIILDELNLAPSDILEALNRVLDDNRELYIPETQVLVRAHPNFMVFATQNPPGLYGGRKTLSRAFKNRFIELHFSEIPKDELEIILEKRCLIPKSYSQKMVKTMTTLQQNRRTTTKNNFTLRDLFRWGNRYTFADRRLLEDKQYDWNQHLIDEGYLVLSAKVRTQIETEIITDALFQNFRKKIELQNLFALNSATSKVTKRILEEIVEYKGTQNVVWTFEMRRMAVLVSKSIQFNEPVLLVGPTGCGKTTVCQVLSEIAEKTLRILNCHMHTEGADFLGGLRPCRDKSNSENENQLFEWADGPLIISMSEGSYFLADEISLAEDSVLERLNCVLEPERTILLAEKGGINEDIIQNSEFIIKASDGFQFLATMNPGGDFGKKELSPALRNRFTEIWCTAINSDEDLKHIARNELEKLYGQKSETINKIAETIIDTVSIVRKSVEKLNFSIRDILAWVNYFGKNHGNSDTLTIPEAFSFGLQILFLDALEMLPYEKSDEIENLQRKIINGMHNLVKKNFDGSTRIQINFESLKVENDRDALKFGIKPFYLDINSQGTTKSNEFSFSAPTTKKNLFRVLSALSLQKAILLEGPPGVGKSSLIENIANAIGYNIVRINLCEHTDLTDLFGTDLPAESNALEAFEDSNDQFQLGSFVWRDGPLLSALKAENTWILLDELNLAPQSVLEGLNAILDHRGEVYIPELNKTFKLGHQTRIFAAQNPLRQGGGRKGLPQSFLNRFTKVYLRKLEKSDLLHVIRCNFGKFEDVDALKNFNFLEKLVSFSIQVETGMGNLDFGYKGGPFEANLRDILRWCKLIINDKTGFDLTRIESNSEAMQDFILTVYEKMKLVYCCRMRSESDVDAIEAIFSDVFACKATELNQLSKSVAMYWNDSNVYFNDIKWSTISSENHLSRKKSSIILSSQIETIKNVTECILMEKPIILCGPSDCGKTKIIDTFCTIFNKNLELDSIDDSVTGSFQQFDFNRLLEDLWKQVEKRAFDELSQLAVHSKSSNERCTMLNLFKFWKSYEDQTIDNIENLSAEDELNVFCKRIEAVKKIINILKESDEVKKWNVEVDFWLRILAKSPNILNSGGRFEWVDSIVVKAVKFGHFVCLDHVNLASSAILDRLNPILEPNGTLLIAEKGVDENNIPETLEKHQTFRIFMTMDPKHGEISRAMRNRCIEISLQKENYSEDDLRKLIFVEGVKDFNMIQAIIDIHKAASEVSEFSHFGVSHLVKMAFLFAQNSSMGLHFKKSLTTSALEVYVRSSNVDLLGFGLSYYRRRLREVITSAIEKIEVKESFVDFENLIIRADELTSTKLVKLQAEPISTLMKAGNLAKQTTNELSVELEGIEWKNDRAMIRNLMALFYMMSSKADTEIRNMYLNDTLQNDKENRRLNANLSVITTKMIDHLEVLLDVPWNSKILPRLREYQSNRLSPSFEFKVSLALLLEMTLEEISTKPSMKKNEVDIISYSRAVNKKKLSDTVDNKLVRRIFELLNLFKQFVFDFLSSSSTTIDDESFVKLILSFLWFNRILNISSGNLYIHNSVNVDLIDQLSLHFKWFSKHCVSFFSSCMDQKFIEIFYDVQNFLLSHNHPMKLYKKIYMKNFTNFLPFYEESQVNRFQFVDSFDSCGRIIGKLDRLFEFEEYQNRLKLLMSENYQSTKRQEIDGRSREFDIFIGCWTEEMKTELGELIENFTEEIALENSNKNSHKIESFLEFSKTNEDVNFGDVKFEIEILPILEYFLLKTLFKASRSAINSEYIIDIPSLGIRNVNALLTINDRRFEILHRISSFNSTSKEFDKNYSTLTLKVDQEIQNIIHESVAINSHLCLNYNNRDNYQNPSQLFINHPLLTSNVLAVVVTKAGEFRGTGLGEIDKWKTTLRTLKNVVWSNAEVNGNAYAILENYKTTQNRRVEKLLAEIDIVQSEYLNIENENFSDFNKDFWAVVDAMKSELMTTGLTWKSKFVLSCLEGIVKLNLLCYFPLMDPVKKNLFKTQYLNEDIDHLETMLTAYKFMAVMMSYENLGKENRTLLENQIEVINLKLSKFSKKVALRPEVCLYSSLSKDVNHFLASCCHPRNLLELINDVSNILDFTIDSENLARNLQAKNARCRMEELMSKIDLWIVNANKFEHHTLQRYRTLYRDFIEPINCSLTSLKGGFMGLRGLLRSKIDSIQVTDAGVYWNINEDDQLSSAMTQLIKFPSIPNLQILESSKHEQFSLSKILEKIPHGENYFYRLVNSNVQEIFNKTSIEGKSSAETFRAFDFALNIVNKFWQRQEETKRKRQEEEDSLYVTKTKCKEEDEEAKKLREIAVIFPNFAEDDFEEFLRTETLEQVADKEKVKRSPDVIGDPEYKAIGLYFLNFMKDEFKSSRNIIKSFEDKLKVFQSIFEHFKTCLDSSLDESAHASLSLIIGLCQENYDDLQLKDTIYENYNFYKDSNITEALACVDVLNRLEKRVNIELDQWPDHAVLNDIIVIISRIRYFASYSPLVRFNTGLQILRQKIDEWNSVAHKLNNFKDLEFEIAALIQKWMRMELQCWRESLNQSLEAISSKAYRWWFFLYNLVHEYLNDNDCDEDSSLVDFKDAEKRFASDEIMEEKPKSGRVTIQSLENVLKQFIESSNYAEFNIRMELLKSFQIYLQHSNSSKKKCQLINLIHNVHLYFTQFSARIQEQIDFVRKPVEKKLKDFVKIESFNKDLSYFSMRTSIQRVHRNLHKILKEFEIEVSKKIFDLFTYRDSNTEFNDFRSENAWKLMSIQLESFVVNEIETTGDVNEMQKYSIKSRKIVGKALENAKYEHLLEDFINIMDIQLETCLHLRTLEVNRDQPRNKQKSQAKQILNQKRKALTDFFKLLSRVGVSYRSGILTSQLKPELVDLQLEPFHHGKLRLGEPLNAGFKNANHRLDHYFNKVLLKMKQLTNALLMPRPDMDYAFLERMKGFSIDLFDIVQQQRENLSRNVNDVLKLERIIAEIKVIIERSNNQTNFECESKQRDMIKTELTDGITILTQFEILMKCAPSDVQSNQRILMSSNNIFTQKSSLLSQIVSSSADILREMKTTMASICSINTKFVDDLTTARKSLQNINEKLNNLKELFVVDDGYSIYGQSIVDLHRSINKKLAEINNMPQVASSNEPINLDQHIEKASHSILIAIQNIYKKFEENPILSNAEDEESYELRENHLKDKIHQQLVDDFKLLNVSKINTQLDSILEVIFSTSNIENLQMMSSLYPMVQQYELLCSYFLIQQANSNRSTSKMLSIMLSVFLELSTKGFCVPQDLLSDEEQKDEKDSKTGEGFGFEDGTGENDVSDKLESEDQLDEAKRPEDFKNNSENDQKDCKEEEKGIDMSQDFEGKMQDVDKNDDDSDKEKEDEEEELDKEMGETEDGAEKLDDQIWGSDAEENEDESKENKDEDGGKGASEKDDKHDDLGNEEGQADGQEEDEALDATAGNENQQKQEQKKDIDKIDDQGEEEDQTNSYHNELEEPPQPEDIDLEDNMDLDNDDRENTEKPPEENPFDIDTMKDNMEMSEETSKDEEEIDEKNKDENVESGSDESDDENQQESTEPDTIDPDQNENENTEENVEKNEDQEQPQMQGEIDNEEEKPDEDKKDSAEKSSEPKDKNQSKEENLQAMPDQNPKSSSDNTQVEVSDETAKQENEIDEQDTGEDRDGIGQAENQESKSGHQGIADTNEMKSKPRSREEKQQQKRKTGNTDEDRTLGDVDKMEKKHLKTVDQMDRSEKNDENPDEEIGEDADEFQHVKDAKSTDKTTLDNATEEQSKKIHHDENSKKQDDDEILEKNDELMENEREEDVEMLDKNELESNKNDNKSEKRSKNNERSKDQNEQTEEVEIEGDDVLTFNVPRGDETTAHCQMDILNDASNADEPTTAELLELRKQVENEMSSTKIVNPDSSDMEQWQDMSNRMANNARDLCEQLRLILEPTKCTRLKGDYRTGRRINMKKIIPYIASQFRKDKIWLRRTKAAQRDYKITIAVDDSKSMDHNNSKNLTMQAISLVAQALTLLESGKLCVLSFGEAPKVLLKYNEQFNGPKIVSSLSFEQNQSKIAELLNFSRTMNQEDTSGDNGIFEHLLIVLSDGRNIFSEGEQKVKNAVKLARLQRMFIVYIIIDNPDNKHSILDIRVPKFSPDMKTITMHSYLDTFPFPYYVIVRDLNQLPLVLSDGLRQWFELVNSDQ